MAVNDFCMFRFLGLRCQSLKNSDEIKCEREPRSSLYLAVARVKLARVSRLSWICFLIPSILN